MCEFHIKVSTIFFKSQTETKFQSKEVMDKIKIKYYLCNCESAYKSNI
jgi:hypothetical protein